ncbi:uroporphyrinogen-III synthase [Alteromonas sp. ASW11-130]|uniref:uroporphyrinogen-III synthase n=1 Tax=Alteromonas sp. ASW11-130 TaxID=3015775 RepID=UPI0022419313|nr:uroporphyrinogen-III synthase [Alteromonas sp. ASW11-130]MCW8091112.1 uroporphyrinogen-III synthase [Alteromonas sp. ASW11-130]
MYLLTRPRPKLAASCAQFAARGISVTGIATLDIEPLVIAEASFSKLRNLASDDWLIITSTFAAKILAQSISPQNIHAKCVAIGDSTANLLKQHGFSISTPNVPTSEGMLDMLRKNNAKNCQAVIMKGEGGREYLAERLTKIGITPTEIAVYRRNLLSPPVESNQWRWTDVKGIITTSVEMALPLFTHYDSDKLISAPWLTVSQRIADTLISQGVKSVGIAEGASDAALIKWVQENWES